LPTPSGLLYGSTGDVNASGGGRLWLIDVTSQSATLVGNTGFDRLGGIAFDSNGTLYGVSGGATHPPSTFLTIDPTNGQATVIGLISDAAQGVDGLRFNSQGVLYGSSWDNNVSIGKLLTIDPSNADVLTSLTLTGDGDAFCAGIAFDPLDVLYGSRGGGSHDADIDLIDPVTGVLTPIGPRETTISDVAFAPDGTLYGSSPNGNLYTIQDALVQHRYCAIIRPGSSTSIPNANTHAYGDSNIHADTNSYVYSHTNGYLHPDANGHGYSHTNGYLHPDANGHGYGNSDGNLNTYPNNCTETNTYAQAATDSPASAMTLIPK